MKKIAVLTYPVKHRKTYDTLSLLRANGYTDVTVYAVPFHYQKKHVPIIQHRPEMNFQIPEIDELCSNLGYRYEQGNGFKIDKERIVLIAGSGILPEEFVDNHIIINAHPGYIPNCRGLDAFKWAIAEMQPIGVTTHLLGREIDAGKIIERRIIDIYKTDTFHSVAERVYENEVSMLVEAIEKIMTSIWRQYQLKAMRYIKECPKTLRRILWRCLNYIKKTTQRRLCNIWGK